jgi:hypothetical protein
MPTETIEIAGQEHQIEVKPITIICQNGDMRIKYKRLELTDIDTLYHIENVKLLHPKALEFYHIVFPEFLTGFTQEEMVQFSFQQTEHGNGIKITYFQNQHKELGWRELSLHDWVQTEGSGSRHVLGLVDMTLKLIDMNVPVVWIHPESHLHPSAQANLADLALAFVEYAKTDEEKQANYIASIKREIGYKNENIPPKPDLNLGGKTIDKEPTL